MNKKGWLRILEATISILMILSAFVILYDIQKVNVKNDPTNQIYSVVDLVSKNETIRHEILNNDSNAYIHIKAVIDKNVDLKVINYTFKICEKEQICNIDLKSINRNIYSYERIISSDLLTNNLEQSKKLRIFYWERY